MIKIVCGLPGSGKSLLTAELITRYIDGGRLVATNVALKPWLKEFVFDLEWLGDVRLTTFWRYLPPGITYVIDEADIYWDALDFKKFGDVLDARIYFKQHRHRCDTVYFVCQNLANIYGRIKRQCQSVIACENTLRTRPFHQYLPKFFRSFIRTEYGSERLRADEIVTTAFLRHDEAEMFYKAYDTESLSGDEEKYQWGVEYDGDESSGVGALKAEGRTSRNSYVAQSGEVVEAVHLLPDIQLASVIFDRIKGLEALGLRRARPRSH